MDPDHEEEKAGEAEEPFNFQELLKKEKHSTRESKYAYAKAREQFQGSNKEWQQSFARSEIIKKMPTTELRRRSFKVEEGI